MIEYADVVIAHSEITFPWMDRVKILLNGKACLRVEIKTENEVGRTQSASNAYTPRLFPRRRGGGYAEAIEPHEDAD